MGRRGRARSRKAYERRAELRRARRRKARRKAFFTFFLGIVVLSIVVFAAIKIVDHRRQQPLKSGLELLQQGDYEAAEKSFEKALDSKRLQGEAYQGIGICKWEQEDYEGALEAFSLALDHNVEKTSTLYNFLGTCELRLGNAETAIHYYELGIACEDSADEMIQEMKYNTLVAYEQLGDWETVRTKLAEYLEAYPDDERAVKEAAFFETQ